jgi:hypothetical protein
VEKEDILEGKIDSLMRRLEKMEIEKKEAQYVKAAEPRTICEECGGCGHVHKDCPEEAKVLDYMRKGDLPNFCYGQGSVTTPSEIIPYNRLNHSIWSLSDTKESSR